MALDLGKQLGPLPLGAWIVVVGGGLGIAYYTRNAGTGAVDTVPAVDTSGQPGVGDGTVGSPGWISTGPTGSPPAVTGPDLTTNEGWGQAAIAWLMGQNYDPVLVLSAVSKYLAGDSKLSVSENTLIGQVTKALGAAPFLPVTPSPTPITPVTPPVSVPGPTKPPAKPPAKPPVSHTKHYRYYTVRRGDSLWSISQKYYGTGARYGTIYNANKSGKKRADGKMGMIKNAALIQPGWSLLIP